MSINKCRTSFKLSISCLCFSLSLFQLTNLLIFIYFLFGDLLSLIRDVICHSTSVKEKNYGFDFHVILKQLKNIVWVFNPRQKCLFFIYSLPLSWHNLFNFTNFVYMVLVFSSGICSPFFFFVLFQKIMLGYFACHVIFFLYHIKHHFSSFFLPFTWAILFSFTNSFFMVFLFNCFHLFTDLLQQAKRLSF